MNVVTEHRRREFHRLGDEVFADNNYRYACGTEVFLRARKDKTVFRNVCRFRTNAGREVCDKGNIACFGQF